MADETITVVVATNTMYGIRLDTWALPDGVKLSDFGAFMRNIRPDYGVVVTALERRGARRVGYKIGRKNLKCGNGYTFIYDNGRWYAHHSSMKTNRVCAIDDIVDNECNNELYYGTVTR